MKFEIPASLQREHDELRDFLHRAAQQPGDLGAAALFLQRVLEPHLRREEAFAFPPLGLLAGLAKGRLSPEMAEVFAKTEWLEQNLPGMLAEHRVITAALKELLHAAWQADQAGYGEYAGFAEKLYYHQRIEEEVTYPAAILAGEYLKLRLAATVE